MTAVLDLQNVTVRRGGANILDAVSWTVHDGQRWVVLGRNGAGKTTLLQVAGARLHPSRGSATVLGQRLGKADTAELATRAGLCSAALADQLPPGERVLDVVLTGAYAVTGRWRETYEGVDESRARDLLTAFGVDTLADRAYGTLSEGECKRVQIARALMADPELLLLDEPGAGLDLAGREELVAALAELAGDVRSPVLVLVTHHVEEIPPGFTHALVLCEGTVHACGTVEQVLTAEVLSGAFGLGLDLDQIDGRWSARAAGDQPRRRAKH
ncbi:MAG: ABC transporter ATP-binding protein [Micrococcales bacterium]|nr:ABC transporter ATP-binding protein [Micrococcales bacterium]